MRKMEKRVNFAMDLENQVSYTLDTICDPNIMTLAQAVLEIFCLQASIIKMKNFEKGNNSAMTNLMDKKKKYGSS